MRGPTSKHHDLDLWDPVAQLPYLGEPLADFIALAEADGWTVDLYPPPPPRPNASTRERAHIVTLQARYDYVPVAHRGGRVVAIGQQAPYYRDAP